MPRRRHDSLLYALARRGAAAQLGDLVQEAKYLIDLFPHLRDSFDKDELPIRFIMAKDSGRVRKTGAAEHQRRRRSAAVRTAISERTKNSSAKRRKARDAGSN